MKCCLLCQAEFQAANWQCPACGNSPAKIDGFTSLAPEVSAPGSGFHPEMFGRLAVLEAANFWFKARNRLIIWALNTTTPGIKNYLEVGCGTGYVLAGIANNYPNASVVGTEVFTAGLPFAAQRTPAAEFIQMDARHMPFVDEFDLVGAFDVLEHIEEDEVVLAAMFRALHAGGSLAVTVPQHQWLWSSTDETACHVRRYASSELQAKMAAAGFKIAFDTSFVSLLLPAMLASRLKKRRPAAHSDDELSELKLPHWLNSLFEAVMRFEFFLIKQGFRFAAGGSRLIIAKK
jgi:SAM-dependent methyltransferase